MIELREYVTVAGTSPYSQWLTRLAKFDHQAAVRVTLAITRLSEGNTGKLKALGPGLAEIRIDFGARERWRDYRIRRRGDSCH